MLNYLGCKTAMIDVKHLISETPSVETFACNVVLEKPDYFVDITILDCSQLNFWATKWLELDRMILKQGVKWI